METIPPLRALYHLFESENVSIEFLKLNDFLPSYLLVACLVCQRIGSLKLYPSRPSRPKLLICGD
jgi:hypothetical protein